jgi:RHS repeat-associated protein
LSSNLTNGIFTLGNTFQNAPGQPRSGWVYSTGPCPGPPTCSGNTYAGLYSITPTAGASQPVTQTVTTSPAGNVSSFTPAFGTVTNLTYNQANRLATVSGAGGQLTQYAYDAFGRRVIKVGASTATTLYQYDRAGHLLEENDGLGTSRVDYIYLDDRPVATIEPSTGSIYFLHDDRLGTPQIATDASQTVQWTATYQPFGYTSTGVGLIVQNLRLPGQEFDLETGLYHSGFRDYIPGIGRYLESDPIGLAGGMNTYGYVGGNPTASVDLFGLDCRAKNGTATCDVPGLSASVSFPQPTGWADEYDSSGIWNDALWHHQYDKPVSTTSTCQQELMDLIIGNPTPAPVQSPATATGTLNNASPPGYANFNNYVMSYLTRDSAGDQVVVNVTTQNHWLFPGYVVRLVIPNQSGGLTVHNYGEGWAIKQSNFNPIYDFGSIWISQSQGLIDRLGSCTCHQ